MSTGKLKTIYWENIITVVNNLVDKGKIPLMHTPAFSVERGWCHTRYVLRLEACLVSCVPGT